MGLCTSCTSLYCGVVMTDKNWIYLGDICSCYLTKADISIFVRPDFSDFTTNSPTFASSFDDGLILTCMSKIVLLGEYFEDFDCRGMRLEKKQLDSDKFCSLYIFVCWDTLCLGYYTNASLASCNINRESFTGTTRSSRGRTLVLFTMDSRIVYGCLKCNKLLRFIKNYYGFTIDGVSY